MKARRAALDDGALSVAAAALAARLVTVLEPYSRIAGYLAIHGEMSLEPALQACRSRGAATFVPVVRHQNLHFIAIDDGTPLVSGPFGIAEPGAGNSIDPMALQAVLLPLVAFDSQGNRLGMGGGFYDRCFAGVASRRRKGLPTPQLIGVAHAFQQVSALQPAAWDVPLDQVVTDEGVLEPARNSR